MHVHLAPGEGLMLAGVIFDAYNQHKSQPPHTYPLELHTEDLPCGQGVHEFKRRLLYPQVLAAAKRGVSVSCMDESSVT